MNVNPKLKAVVDVVTNWCDIHNIKFDWACDESDIQGIKLFQKNRTLINKLLEHITPFLEENNVHIENEKVRGGTIIALSLEAISENTLKNIITSIGEEIEPMSFQDRIEDAMTRKPLPVVQESPKTKETLKYDFLKSAIKIIEDKDAESDDRPSKRQYKNKDSIGTKNSQVTKDAVTGATKGASKGHPIHFEQRLDTVLGLKSEHKKNVFRSNLREALNGMATPTDAQPQDLFAKFARALRVLGDQMSVGPLQDLLKSQGINWKKSDDGQSVILYIVNAQTNAPQPIARISAETLENPSDFEEQLTHMLDFAKGDAPGSFKQKQQEIKDQEKAVRDIARAVSPQDRESEVAKQMNSNMPNGAAAAAAPQQNAGIQAATMAASPKPGM